MQTKMKLPWHKPKSLWEKLYHLVLLCTVSLFFLFVKWFSYPEEKNVEFYVTDKNKVITIIDSTASYKIYQANKINYISSTRLEYFFAPTLSVPLEDSLHFIFILTFSIMVILLIRKEHKSSVFSINLSRYTVMISQIAFLFLILLSLRDMYFRNKITELTENRFYMDMLKSIFGYPEFWIAIVLGKLTYIIKKGEVLKLQNEVLQQEQELII